MAFSFAKNILLRHFPYLPPRHFPTGGCIGHLLPGEEKFGGGGMSVLFVLILFLGFVVVVDVSVEHRKSDKECHTDQVFNRFYVLVIVNQREYLLHFTNRS
jgi:hypothetical protein